MSDHLQRALDNKSRMLAGATPVEQHIILLKLSELIEKSPDLTNTPISSASPQRQWLAEIGALLCRISYEKKSNFNTAKVFLTVDWNNGVNQIVGLALDSIEELKLELELSGKADIGNAYAPGDVYKYFTDLKSIVNNAQSEIFLIDPYFDGAAFDNYLSNVSNKVNVRIFANKHAQEIKSYIDKHTTQFNSDMEVKKNKKLHDRLIIIDQGDCWITGGSINHAGQKSPSYLIPVNSEIASNKLTIYHEIWNDSQEIA